MVPHLTLFTLPILSILTRKVYYLRVRDFAQTLRYVFECRNKKKAAILDSNEKKMMYWTLFRKKPNNYHLTLGSLEYYFKKKRKLENISFHLLF